jgi:decaprenyl-phosphate phosphoribosyltransferase
MANVPQGRQPPAVQPPSGQTPAAQPFSGQHLEPVAADGPQNGAAGTPRSGRSSLRNYLRALRPRQWVKNLLVFVAPAVAGVLFKDHHLVQSLAAFGIFCAVASGQYLINDTADAAADRLHPRKRNRPIAAGEVPVLNAVVLGLSLICLSLGMAWLLAGWRMFAVIAAYVAVSMTYTFWLKTQAVLELAAVAAGFVLRAVGGAVATHVQLSSWFLVVTSFGALFVVVGKRAAEFQHLGEGRAEHRPVLSEYSTPFLQATLTLAATVTVTAYCLWAFERDGLLHRPGVHFVWIQLTVVPVVLGILHVLRLLLSGKGGAPEELAFTDRLLQLLGVVWVALFAIGIYA